jgi:O-succinylbenzoate synthase
MSIDVIRLHRLNVPLVRPFRTSFGTESVRDVILVEAVSSDGVHGWGECVTMSWPGYSYEYGNSAIAVMEEHLLPALGGAIEEGDPEEIRTAMDVVRGHPMAKAALSTALLDVWLREREMSLGSYLGAVRTRVDCGVSVGIPATESVEALLEEVAGYIDAGYRRIKLKIEPGWDIAPVSAVRAMWPDMPLQTDANQAYTRADAAHLALLDEYDLLLHEQPLEEEDWYGHVLMSRACRTPICMDESIHSVASADSALEFGAASIINIKPGRVGGYLTARDGMLETGIGRAANVALAALPGFTLPGDTSASSRYYEVDVTEPFVLDDGQLDVPTGPGIGVDPLPDVLADLTVWSGELRPSA